MRHVFAPPSSSIRTKRDDDDAEVTETLRQVSELSRSNGNASAKMPGEKTASSDDTPSPIEPPKPDAPTGGSATTETDMHRLTPSTNDE